MQTLIIYDSLHGNTQDIAKAIYEGLNIPEKRILAVEKATTQDLKNIQLLIVGSPTHGGTAKHLLLEFLKRIPNESLNGVKIATFDTRFLESKQKTALKLLMKVIGYAAPKIAKKLESKGGVLVDKPQGFFVKAEKGPLLPDELVRAKKWSIEILSKIS